MSDNHTVFFIEQRQKGRRSLRGSYTVEAALVIPVIFFVLAALVITSFYLHDRAVLQGAACEIAASGSNMVTQKESREVMLELKKQVNQARLLGSRKLAGTVSAEKKEVSASFQAEYPVSGIVKKYRPGGKLAIQKNWKAKRMTPAKTIWVIRGAKDLLEGEKK